MRKHREQICAENTLATIYNRSRQITTICDSDDRLRRITTFCDNTDRPNPCEKANKHRERNVKGCLTALPDLPSMSGVLSNLGRSTEMPWRLAIV
jgi:hypothetical protein